ncbi:MAG: hypothetical protein EOP06_22140 [Proteobacteria bacterium]|nr:MAG: hypothetical protein EOP06_22140 [Pseudomonadota bacterium]
MKIASILLAAIAVVASGCDMKTNLDEMHDKTVQMEQTTSKVEKHSESLDQQTGELYDALRQGDALQSRRTALANLLAAKDPLRKLSEASKYFMAFEYQLWSGIGADVSEQKRNTLAMLAAREFFKDVESFIPGGKKNAKPLAGQIIATEKSNAINSLNALAATIDSLNPKQESTLLRLTTIKPLSMYSMIEESLRARAAIESEQKAASEFPAYVSEVLFSEDVAVYLLQARYNYLPALVLGKLTDASHSQWTGARIALAPWTLDTTTLNLVELTEMNRLLKLSNATKSLLQELGFAAPLDPLLTRVYQNMKIQKSSALSDSVRERTEAELETQRSVVIGH